MRPIGRDGRPLPSPPEAPRPLSARAIDFLRLVLGSAAALAIPLAISVALHFNALIDGGWAEAARRLAVAAAILIVTGMAVAAVITFMPLLFGRAAAREAGRRLEHWADGLSREELDEAIAEADAALADPQSRREHEAYAEWRAWLEARRQAWPALQAGRRQRQQQVGSWTLRPAPWILVVMGAVAALPFGLGIWLLVDGWRSGELSLLQGALALAAFAGAAWFFGEVGTVRLELTPAMLRFRKFDRVRWSVDRRHAVLVVAMVNEGAVSGFAVLDAVAGRKVGEIISTQFRTAELDRLAAMFARAEEAAPS